MAQDYERSISKSITFSKDRNIHNLTPKQQAIRQQTIHRHLSNRRLPGNIDNIHCIIILAHIIL